MTDISDHEVIYRLGRELARLTPVLQERNDARGELAAARLTIKRLETEKTELARRWRASADAEHRLLKEVSELHKMPLFQGKVWAPLERAEKAERECAVLRARVADLEVAVAALSPGEPVVSQGCGEEGGVE
jgi:predicted nuclease with TOPRIM domain